MATAASTLSPRVSVATSVSKEQPSLSASALPHYSRSARGPLKRRSRRRRAVAGAIGNDLQLPYIEEPGFAQNLQRPPTSPQYQAPGVALQQASAKKRKRRDEITPPTTVPCELGSASAGLQVNASPRTKIIHTYSRKITDVHRAVVARNGSWPALHPTQDAVDPCDLQASGAENNDARYRAKEQQPQRRRVHLRKRKSKARADEVPNIENVVTAGKLPKPKGKRKRRAPVEELALVRSAAETETPLSQVEALSRPDPYSEVLQDLIEISPKTDLTTINTKKLLPSITPSASSTCQKSLSMIRKTIKLPRNSSHILSFEGCQYKQPPDTPRRSALPARRLGSGFEGLEASLPPKEPRRESRRYRRGNKVPAEVSSLEFAEVTRETKPRGVPLPAQPSNKRSKAFPSARSFDNNLSGREKTNRRLFHSIEKDGTDMQPHDKSRYMAFPTHAEDPVHLPNVHRQSQNTTASVRPIIALHRNQQLSGYFQAPPAGRIDDQPRYQACHIRRRVTFEDEICPQPPGHSSPPQQTSTVANATREVEANDEEVPSQSSRLPCTKDESDAEDIKETNHEDLTDTPTMIFKDLQTSQLKNFQAVLNTAFGEQQDAMGTNISPSLNERCFPTTSTMASDATSNATFERRVSSGSHIENSDSLGTLSLASSSRRTTKHESQTVILGTDDRLWKVADDIVDDHSPILSAGNHRVMRRGSSILSAALQSSPPPSSNPPSPCRLRAETLRGAIRRQSEIPETQKPYELAASHVTSKGPLRSILKKGSSFGPSQIVCTGSAEKEEEEEEAFLKDLNLGQPIPETSLTTTKYFSQVAQQLNSPDTRPDKIMPRLARALPILLHTSDVDEGEEEHEEPVLSMTRRIRITPNTSRRRSALMSDAGPNQDLRSLTRRMSEELGTTPELKRRLSYIPFIPPFKTR